MSSTAELIVAHYNSKEFEKLYPLCKDIHITVYDKSQSYVAPESETNIKVKHIPNNGREAETYLIHIIDNYDSLAEYTVFIQDDTHNHIFQQDYIGFVNAIHQVEAMKIPYYAFPCSWRMGGNPARRYIQGGHVPVHTVPEGSVPMVCDIMGVSLPARYMTELCAFFMVHKDVIHRYPRDTYIRLKEWVLTNIAYEFTMEHVWVVLFGNHA